MNCEFSMLQVVLGLVLQVGLVWEVGWAPPLPSQAWHLEALQDLDPLLPPLEPDLVLEAAEVLEGDWEVGASEVDLVEPVLEGDLEEQQQVQRLQV